MNISSGGALPKIMQIRRAPRSDLCATFVRKFLVLVGNGLVWLLPTQAHWETEGKMAVKVRI
jgi:hypothetical protein